MSFPKETMLELMSYADGDELDAAARARIEELLRTNEEARRVVDAMGTLGEVVREGAHERLERSGADAIADGVMAALGSPGQDRDVVVPIARARRRSGGAAALVAALAVAAGIVFLLTSKAPAPVAKEEPIEVTPSSAQPATPSSSPAPSIASEALAQAETHGVDLEEVRSIRNKVNVFFMPSSKTASAGATSSVVVWIDDRPGGH